MTAVTSKKAARAASAVLRDEQASPEAKTAAASALAQREPVAKGKLRSVDEWNEQRRKLYEAERHTDIACPGCGSRMERTSNVILATDPPLMSVKCAACGHEASVLA